MPRKKEYSDNINPVMPVSKFTGLFECVMNRASKNVF